MTNTEPRSLSSAIKVVLTGCAALAVLIPTIAGCAPDSAIHEPPAPIDSEAPVSIVLATALVKRTPAPTTVRGYQRMFDSVSADQWLGADVSLSVQMPGKRRVVWLYGDTMSRDNGFVNSTGIVQIGGRLHVSRGGKQLLPEGRSADPDRRAIWWINDARAISKTRLAVSAVGMSVGSGGIWDFKPRFKRNREAIVRLDASNNLHFVKWRAWVKPYDGFVDLSSPERGLLQYERRAHPWAELDSGRCLMTVNNAWTVERPDVDQWDTTEHGPTFYAGDCVEHHRSGDQVIR